VTQEAIEALTEPLQIKLIALPTGATVADFTGGEQAELISAFGADWAAQLGIAE